MLALTDFSTRGARYLFHKPIPIKGVSDHLPVVLKLLSTDRHVLRISAQGTEAITLRHRRWTSLRCRGIVQSSVAAG